MIRHALILLVTFVIGALLTTAVRAAGHRPPPPVAAAPEPAMAPASLPAPPAAAPVEAAAAPAEGVPSWPVNTICPGCGGPVLATIPTAVYRGKVIGFNCAGCRPRFLEEPDRYGAAALRNEVAP